MTDKRADYYLVFTSFSERKEFASLASENLNVVFHKLDTGELTVLGVDNTGKLIVL